MPAVLAGLVLIAAAPAVSAQQPNPASAPDTTEGMSAETDTTNTITPGVNDPASTPDTAEGFSAETDTSSTITPGVNDPASTPDTADGMDHGTAAPTPVTPRRPRPGIPDSTLRSPPES
jgi:hypothetical protein